jgi:hypothetical protein
VLFFVHIIAQKVTMAFTVHPRNKGAVADDRIS